MYQPINQVRLRGFLTESARLFVSRSGQPRITFRMEVWIDDENLPPKRPAGVDYFSMVAFGTEFVNLLPHLALEREVTLAGRLRSRDVDTESTLSATLVPTGSLPSQVDLPAQAPLSAFTTPASQPVNLFDRVHAAEQVLQDLQALEHDLQQIETPSPS